MRTNRRSKFILPENENEEYEEREEDSHVVHRPEHDKELSPQVGHEPDQLENPQQPEGPQDAKTRTPFAIAECVDEDGEQDALLEVLVLHEALDEAPEAAQARRAAHGDPAHRHAATVPAVPLRHAAPASFQHHGPVPAAGLVAAAQLVQVVLRTAAPSRRRRRDWVFPQRIHSCGHQLQTTATLEYNAPKLNTLKASEWRVLAFQLSAFAKRGKERAET
ncbi:hypothetical protein C0J52_21130 [Blattella germanica]|nr:hypothetical protein C0J52_21130 [Blattella germanica]